MTDETIKTGDMPSSISTMKHLLDEGEKAIASVKHTVKKVEEETHVKKTLDELMQENKTLLLLSLIEKQMAHNQQLIVDLDEYIYAEKKDFDRIERKINSLVLSVESINSKIARVDKDEKLIAEIKVSQ